MSTKTSNYQLHQWEPNDQFLREDFNTDFAKIDAGIKHAYDHAGEVESNLTAQLTSTRNTLNTAIGKKADQTALTALQTTVNTKATTAALNALQTVVSGKTEVVLGTYTGNEAATQAINVGFQPRVVFLMTADGLTYLSGSVYGGLFGPGLPLKNRGGDVSATVTATGFSVVGGNTNHHVNQNFTVYHYLCFK